MAKPNRKPQKPQKPQRGSSQKPQVKPLGLNSKIINKMDLSKLNPKDIKQITKMAQVLDGLNSSKQLSNAKYAEKQKTKRTKYKTAGVTTAAATGSSTASRISENKTDEQIAYYNSLINNGADSNYPDDQEFLDPEAGKL